MLPQYWPVWAALGVMRTLAWLPYSWLLACGRGFGTALRVLPLPHARIARRNLELCLPEVPAGARERILRDHLGNVGCAIGETALAWYASDRRIGALSRLDGFEHLEAALGRGRGAILVSAHFTPIELGVRILATATPLNAVYRPVQNDLLEAFLARRRSAGTKRAIRRDDVRTVVRALRANEPVWVAPDQAYRKKGAIMVPFFGIPAATNPAVSRLARATGAAVLPFFVERLGGERGYRAAIEPALEGFPSADPGDDAMRLHRVIETRVRANPTQYLWIHRRFKGLGSDYPNYYGRHGRPANRPS